jgi:hypothetical protein
MKSIRPWHIVLIVHLLYLGLILAVYQGDPMTFVKFGTGPNKGYDGQFNYLIAIDPSPDVIVREIQDVRSDVPAYRYQRILLPLLARILGFGQPDLIVWLLPLISLISQVVGTALVERLLLQLNVSRWYALVYGLWPGLMVSVRTDLAEPLSYALVAAAYLLYWRKQLWLSAVCFGLALFAKETAILFIAAQLVYAVLAREWKVVGSLSAVAVLPFVIWQFVLKAMFGSFGVGSGGYLGTPFELIPFNGVWRIASQNVTVFIVFLLFLVPWVVFPSIWGIIASARELIKRNWHPYVWALAVNAVIIPFTPFSTFREPIAMFRFCTGLVLSTLLFGGLLNSRRVLNYSAFWLAMIVFLLRD